MFWKADGERKAGQGTPCAPVKAMRINRAMALGGHPAAGAAAIPGAASPHHAAPSTADDRALLRRAPAMEDPRTARCDCLPGKGIGARDIPARDVT